MSAVEVIITQGALPAANPWHHEGAGAVVVFDGIVRPTEGQHPIAGLVYEAYEPLTSRMLHELGQSIVDEFGLIALHVEHSVGFVANHGVSFRLSIASAHRKEALTAMDQFIDRMKAQVPLWKVPRWADESTANETALTTSSQAKATGDA